MPIEIIKGEISENHGIEWTIKNIFSYVPVDNYSFSIQFSILGAEWRLCLYPNGQTRAWMDLKLTREDACTSPKSIYFDFGIKTRDGKVEMMAIEDSHVFRKESPCFGYYRLFSRSNLLARKSELAPSGNLTITCNMRTNASLETESGANKLETAPCQENHSTTIGLQQLSEDLKKMFLSSKGCDATLKVRNEEFPVHRSILASRSPVFEAMFEADMKEKNTGVVDIVDCHPKAFEDFLLYIYSGKFENSSGEIFELYSIAHKYDVEQLKSDCVAFILENLTSENVVDAYATGHRFHEEDLKKKSQDFFDEHVAEIISNDKWDSLFKEKPAFVNMLLKSMAENTKIQKKDGN